MELLKAKPFRVIFYSDFYQSNEPHFVQLIKYSVVKHRFYFDLYCQRDLDHYGDMQPIRCSASTEEWKEIIESTIH